MGWAWARPPVPGGVLEVTSLNRSTVSHDFDSRQITKRQSEKPRGLLDTSGLGSVGQATSRS